MLTYFFAALVFGLVVVGMSLGVIFSNKPIKGSCGGLGALGLDAKCEICGGNPKVCEEETRNQAGIAAGLFDDAEDRPRSQFYDAGVGKGEDDRRRPKG